MWMKYYKHNPTNEWCGEYVKPYNNCYCSKVFAVFHESASFQSDTLNVMLKM